MRVEMEVKMDKISDEKKKKVEDIRDEIMEKKE